MGNIEDPKEVNFTIKQDYFPPETSVEVIGTKGENSYYISPVTIGLNAVDEHSAIDYSEYSLDGGQTWNRYVQPFPINDQDKTIIYYRSRDIDGNIEKTQKYKVNIDLLPPSAPEFAISPELWSNSSFVVTIFDGVDDQSGTWKSQYRIEGSETWLDYTVPVTVSGSSFRRIYARTVDYAGNVSEVAEYTLQFETVAPGKPTIELSNPVWTNEPVFVNIFEGSDEDSGVRGYEYRIGSKSEDWLVYGGPFSVADEGITMVYGRTVDVAGNISLASEAEVKIDLTPPTAPANIYKVNQLGTSAFIRWSPGTDNLSGIAEYEIYNGDSLLGITQDTKFKLTDLTPGEDFTVTIKSVDVAGNVSEIGTSLTFFVNNMSVSAYRDHNFAWNAQGDVWGWGLNSNGQLGDGTRVDKLTATSNPNLKGFSMISTGLMQNIALRDDGTVWTWGESYRGQEIPLSKVEGLENIVSISSGLLHYLALREDGTVWAWGSNDLGQLGDGTTNITSKPVQVVGLDSVVSIVASYYNSMALREDGTVWIWGDGIRGVLGYDAPVEHKQLVPIKIPNLENIVQIDMSYLHGAALKGDGTVWTWGFNESGQLGDGTFLDHAVPLQVPNLNGVTKVSVSYSQSIALTRDGKVWSWGNNYYGEIGDASGIPKRPTPVRTAHLEGIVDIEAGELYSMAIKKNGSIWAWGNNTYGQLGDGTKVSKTTRTLVNGIPFPADIIPPSAPTQLRTTGKTSTTAVLVWEESTDNHAVKEYLVYRGSTLIDTLGVDAHTIDYTTGYTAVGLEPETEYKFTIKAKDYAGNISNSSNEVTVKTEASLPMSISAGANHTLALKSDGSVWAWGSNSAGQIGDGTLLRRLTPIQANVSSITAISAGGSFSLALKSDGTVWSWGENTIGQLGNSQLAAQQSVPKKIENLNSVVAISAGHTHALALKSDGTVWSWGSNFSGELGLGTTNNSYVPVKIPSLSGVKAISAGMFYSIAVKTDGTVWAWGMNNYGQLGDGTTTNRSVPVRITALSGVEEVAAGLYHALALKQDGSVWSWGYNYYGQLGDGTITNRTTPVRIGTLSGIKQISAGMYHSMARSDDLLYTWGSNANGQLGNNGTSNSSTPIVIFSVSQAKDIDAGYSHSTSLTNNKAMAWGMNGTGQLGDGTITDRRIPVVVNGLVSGLRTQKVKDSLTMNEGKFSEELLMLPEMFYFPDLIPPSAPENVVAEVSGEGISLRWKASTDNKGIKEYWVYADQILITKTTTNSSFIMNYPEKDYTVWTVRAVDEEGNFSDQSIPASL
ncbi:fibronectin type III domain-containing protein [Paenibacillus barengoltzii]